MSVCKHCLRAVEDELSPPEDECNPCFFYITSLMYSDPAYGRQLINLANVRRQERES